MHSNILRHNGSHHPARATKATMSRTTDRVLGVHGIIIASLQAGTRLSVGEADQIVILPAERIVYQQKSDGGQSP